jgi:hypothetical protein
MTVREVGSNTRIQFDNERRERRAELRQTERTNPGNEAAPTVAPEQRPALLDTEPTGSRAPAPVQNPFTAAPLTEQAANYIASLPSHVLQNLQSIASGLTNVLEGSAPAAPLVEQFKNLVADMSRFGGVDVNALVQHVIRESYLQTTEDLHFYAQKVKFFNNLKKAIREELTRARQTLAGVAGKEDTTLLDPAYEKVTIGMTFTGDVEVKANRTMMEGRSADAAFSTATFGGGWTRVGGQWDPLAIDLDGDGKVSTIDVSGGVFELRREAGTGQRWVQGTEADLNAMQAQGMNVNAPRGWGQGTPWVIEQGGDQVTRFTQWFGPTEGIVVLDRNGDGQIQASDLFGDTNVTGRRNADGSEITSGYDDLKALDSNHDGKVDQSDAAFSQLKVWRDGNSDGKVDPGEMMSLFNSGIRSLSANATSGALEGEKAGVIKEGSSFTGMDVVRDKAGLDAYIKGLEEQLSSAGDDAQLANVDLQNVLQKQQQTIQMSSNISKMLHDTGMAITRKIGG